MNQRQLRLWPTLGPALALAAWSFALFAVRSVFGDVLTPGEGGRRQIVAAIDFNFSFYSVLAVVSLVAAIVVAIYTWRTWRVSSRITVGVVAIFVLTVAGVALHMG